MEEHTPPAPALAPTHAHLHYHRTVLPRTQRSVVYWHAHEHHHAHAARFAEPDERHARRAHDHAHDREAFDALTFVGLAA